MNTNIQINLEQALQRCANEEIHQIGLIQPHGALLVVSPEPNHTILQLSENLGEFLDLSAEKTDGKPLAAILGQPAYIRIEQLIQQALSGIPSFDFIRVEHQQKMITLQVRAFPANEAVGLELTHETDTHQHKHIASLLSPMQQKLFQAEDETDLYRYFKRIAELTRDLLEFDRVMVYRFDANWDGEVIAESRNDSAASYLGNRFPASDIPPQARRLYTINLVRSIADIEVTSASIVPCLHPKTGQPLDLTHSDLRSFSQIHLKYLRNMGVQASMSISLMQSGRLWGLIACHHTQAKRVPTVLQEAARLISRIVSSKLSLIEIHEQRHLEAEASQIVGEFIKRLSTGMEKHILPQLMPSLLALLNASGVILMVEGRQYTHGEVPSPTEIDILRAWLGACPPSDVFACEQLEQQFPPAASYAKVAAGLLATPISRDMRDGIIWLRKEKVCSIKWAGNPEKVLSADDRGRAQISPRTSFSSWLALWRGHSLSWSSPESAVATLIAKTLAEGLTQKCRLEAAESKLKLSASVFAHASEAILISSPEGVILDVNEAFARITGYSQDEVIGKNLQMISSGRHDKQFYESMWHVLEERGSYFGEIWNKRKSGEIFPAMQTISAVLDEQRVVRHYVSLFSDLSNQKKAEVEIFNLAFYDSLTGLPNRRMLSNRFKSLISSSSRTQKYGALMFIDIDRFKLLNDTLGHDQGDLLLIEVAKRLEQCVLKVDTVARWGGDEFAVLLGGFDSDVGIASRKTAMVAEKIRVSLSDPYLINETKYSGSVSIGMCLYRGDDHSVDELFKQANMAMYQAKDAGRNTIRFFDTEMQQSVETRATLVNDLRHALTTKQFQLYYQVQVDSDLRPIGAEALIRWIHPTKGMISPAHFIPAAEESGMILDMGDWVLETACQQLAAWSENEQTRHLTLSVNVSAAQFKQIDFVEKFSLVIQTHKIRPSHLKLELTESVALGDVTDVVSKMYALKALQVKLSMDDFGTGYSSLSYLKQLPLDQLKIDQSFVRDMTSDQDDAVMVQTIIDLAKNFHLNIIAEGVETQAQSAQLLQMGCSTFQGYLFGKPLPIDQFEALHIASLS